MIIYLAIFISSILGQLLPRKYHNAFILLLLFVLLLFIGLRHEIGADWNNYMSLQYAIQMAGKEGIYFTEPGYGFLNYYFSGNDSIYLINTICALILLTGTYFLCKDQPYSLLSLSILLPYTIFVVGMGYTRQATALGFVMITYYAFANRKFFISFIFLLFALSFHISAVIVFSLYLLSFLNLNNYRRYVLMAPLAMLTLYILILKSGDLLSIYSNNDEVSSAGGLYRHLMNIIPVMLFAFNHRFFYRRIPKYYSLLWFLSFGSIFLFFLSFQLSTFSDRFAQFFSIIQIIVYPVIIDKFIIKDRKSVLISIVLFYMFFLIYWFTNSYWASQWWANYKNYLFL